MGLAADFVIAQGDTAPPIQATLALGSGAAIDLTGATVRFRMVPANGGVFTVDAAATVVTPALGDVRYDWTAPDTAAAGYYLARWRVTLASGKVESVPNSECLLILITAAV